MLPLIENAPIKPQINTITNFLVETKFESRPAGEWHTAALRHIKTPLRVHVLVTYNTPYSGGAGGSIYYM